MKTLNGISRVFLKTRQALLFFLMLQLKLNYKNNWTLKMEILIWLKVVKDFMIKLNGENSA